MRITKGMISKGVKISFIINYLQGVQKHVTNSELPISVHLNSGSCQPGTRDISLSVFDYTGGIDTETTSILKCSINIMFYNGLLDCEPLVENPLKVVPLIHSNLTPVKFSHSPFCLFLFSSYSSCPLCRVLH